MPVIDRSILDALNLISGTLDRQEVNRMSVLLGMEFSSQQMDVPTPANTYATQSLHLCSIFRSVFCFFSEKCDSILCSFLGGVGIYGP